MLENRAFDHMCGYLNKLNPEIDGLTGNEYNPYDPLSSNSPLVYVNGNSSYVDVDPNHGLIATSQQIFGRPDPDDTIFSDPPPMNGFVANAESVQAGWGPKVMACFTPETVPSISSLATEFAVFDKWFASVPGPTEVNRMYLHSGTSYGAAFNNDSHLNLGYPQKTIYQSLEESGISWKVYMEEVSTVMFFSQMRLPKYASKFRFFQEFEADCKNGQLPSYSHVEPRYFSETEFALSNDEHPSHSVAEGELLLKRIYEIIRNSPVWNSTALLITYDEHGGFFDHVPTPLHNIPNPDGIMSAKPKFNFMRLGVRVPTIVVSPWINRGTVVHEPTGPTPSSHYDHTSVLATLKKVFNLPAFLTKRDEWAGTFEQLFTQRDSPRTDCPLTIPAPPKLKNTKGEHLQPLNDLQKTFIRLASALNGNQVATDNLVTEQDGAEYVKHEVAKFLGKQQV